MIRVDTFQICLWAMCISFEGLTVPFPPRNVAVDVTPHHILVTWDPPIETNDEITMYVVSYSILPDLRITMNNVTGGLHFCRIPVEGQEGRLFKIQVQVQNQIGIGNPSAARYVRIGCGRTLWLDPSASTSLIHPETEGNYKTGFLCQWTLSTKDTCFLTFMFVTLQLVVYSNIPCIEDYVIIGNKGRFCHAQEEGKLIVSRDSNVFVIFNSGRWAPGKGFHLKITSIKLPGPPESITTQSNDNMIILTWTQPTGLTLPLTAYVIRYSVLPDGPTFSKVLEPNIFHFSIGTKRFEGKVIIMNVTARIDDVEGATSNSLKVRAQCHRNIVLEPGGETNIFSPNYPNQYPADIVCRWNIRANTEVTLSAKFLDFQLQDSSFCSSDYITLSINPDQRFCGVMKPSRTFETDESTLDVKFVCDSEDQESGFHLQILAKIKPPGPPTSFTSKFSGNAIILSWAPPTRLTLPITSYVIRYTVQPNGSTFSTDLKPDTFRFSIDTTLFEGKDLLISITAKIKEVEGVTSNPLYVRALKPPGPPTSFTMTPSRNSVILRWAPPKGLTVPITSYVIRYSFIPHGQTYVIVVEANTFYFSIDTTPFEGKDLLINITARIEDVEGVTSNPLFFRVLKPPGPPTAFTMTSSGNFVILRWEPPTGLTMPITSYVIRYAVLPVGSTFSSDLKPDTFHFRIDTTQFEGKDLLISITARIEDVEGVTSNPLYFRAQTSRPTALENPERPTGLTKNTFKCAVHCLYAVAAAIWNEGFFASVGVLGTIAGTAANLLWDYFWGSELNFLDRVKEYVPKWLAFNGLSKGIIKVFNTCKECFQ